MRFDFVMNIGAVPFEAMWTRPVWMGGRSSKLPRVGSHVIFLETSLLISGERSSPLRSPGGSRCGLVKTCTGRGVYGATVEDIKLLVEVVEGKAQVKKASQGSFG